MPAHFGEATRTFPKPCVGIQLLAGNRFGGTSSRCLVDSRAYHPCGIARRRDEAGMPRRESRIASSRLDRIREFLNIPDGQRFNS